MFLRLDLISCCDPTASFLYIFTRSELTLFMDPDDSLSVSKIVETLFVSTEY